MQPSRPSEVPLGLLIATVRRGVRQFVSSRIEPLGISVGQFWVLTGIAEHPAHSQADLAAQLYTDEAMLCRVVRSLVASGWVEGVRDARDRRRIQLALTTPGQALAAKLLPIARAARSAVESGLTRHERNAVRAALLKMVASFQQATARAGFVTEPSTIAASAGRAQQRRKGARVTAST